MSLLLYLNPFNNENLKLPPWCPREYPYTQAVNRCDSSLNPFNYSLKCEKISDIVGMPANNQTYEQMAIARAIDLKKLDNKIYIMYSGGVDSSTAVLAFLMSWNKQELQRVYILCSTKSVKEFPEMWSVIANEFKGRIKTSYKHVENSLRDGYVITGEHGDQIFGSDVQNSSVDQLNDSFAQCVNAVNTEMKSTATAEEKTTTLVDQTATSQTKSGGIGDMLTSLASGMASLLPFVFPIFIGIILLICLSSISSGSAAMSGGGGSGGGNVV